MSVEDIRNRQRTAPDWLAVEMIGRIEALEAKLSAQDERIIELSKPKPRGRPKKTQEVTK